jgi:putative tryptophan/tyrosine transport system substrate-binding protein
VKPRQFITGLGSAAAWPVMARAQQGYRVRRVGVLMGWDESSKGPKASLLRFIKELGELGWDEGHTVRIDVRWTGGDADRAPILAKELVALEPDVILASTTPATAALKRETQAIPIVFLVVADPVGAGFVVTLARPGGNMTGFINLEGRMAEKWVELLLAIAPSVRRVAMMFNPDTAPGGGSYFLPSFEAAARSLNVEPIVAPVHSDAEIVTAVTALGREPGAGLIIMPDGFMFVHSNQVIQQASRNKIPVVSDATIPREESLLYYGPSVIDMFRRAAPYVDRSLRGARPAELPVQLPVKFEMVVNAKTAKALGLTIPETLLATADEVIQ